VTVLGRLNAKTARYSSLEVLQLAPARPIEESADLANCGLLTIERSNVRSPPRKRLTGRADKCVRFGLDRTWRACRARFDPDRPCPIRGSFAGDPKKCSSTSELIQRALKRGDRGLYDSPVRLVHVND
jgi:hypothetical protein